MFPHDEGNAIATKIKANLSPTNGQFYVTQVEEESVLTGAPEVVLPTAYSVDAQLNYSWLGSFGYDQPNLNDWFGLPRDVALRALSAQTDD